MVVGGGWYLRKTKILKVGGGWYLRKTKLDEVGGGRWWLVVVGTIENQCYMRLVGVGTFEKQS